MKNVLSFLVFLMSFSTIIKPISAHQLGLPFAEIVQQADLIFTGMVLEQETRTNEDGTMNFTDVSFGAIEVLHAKPHAAQKESNIIKLSYAGGKVNNKGVSVCGMPNFTNGNCYIIFMFDDNNTYGNPIIGSTQGAFQVVQDLSNDDEFVVTMGQKALTKLSPNELSYSLNRVSSVKNGKLRFDTKAKNYFIDLATPISELDTVKHMIPEEYDALEPIPLERFAEFVLDSALNYPLEQYLLKRGTEGEFYYRNGDAVKKRRLPLQRKSAFRGFREKMRSIIDIEERKAFPEKNTTKAKKQVRKKKPTPKSSDMRDHSKLGACGTHDLPIMMQQVPSHWWSYSPIAEVLDIWNVYLPLFETRESDGFFSNNDEYEIGGWVTDETLGELYGYQWDGALAKCINWWEDCPCCTLNQADVVFNSAYNWTTDEVLALGNRNMLLFRPIAVHELGHAWGFQRGTYPETYKYDDPTVMQAYYHNVVENGKGIHFADAHILRRHYEMDEMPNVLDMGVESYYAQNGVHNSAPNKNEYGHGEAIELRNVLVENISDVAIGDVRLRFYLSLDRTIDPAVDYPLGSDWSWKRFDAESYNVGNYSTNIPSDIPPNDYYIGALVTISGYAKDDYPENNATTFYKTVKIKESEDNYFWAFNDSKNKELFVNPFSNYIHTCQELFFSNNMTFKILDLAGEELEGFAPDSFLNIHRFGQDLPQGMYLVQAFQDGEMRKTDRVYKFL